MTTSSIPLMRSSEKLRPFLRIQLFALLQSLHENEEVFQWSLLAAEDNGVFKLLGFQNFADYFDFMFVCGFMGNMYRGKKCLWFKKSEFMNASKEKFIVQRYGGKKQWHIKIGQKLSSTDGTPTVADLEKPEFNKFWHSTPVYHWLQIKLQIGFLSSPFRQKLLQDIRNIQRMAGSPATIKHAAIEKRSRYDTVSANKRPYVRQRLKSPLSTWNLPNNATKEKSHHSTTTSSSIGNVDMIRTPRREGQLNPPPRDGSMDLEIIGTPLHVPTKPRQLFTSSPVKEHPTLAPEKETIDNISDLTTQLQSRLHVVANPSLSCALPRFMTPTKASKARDEALLKVAAAVPDFGNAITRIADKINIEANNSRLLKHAPRAKRILVDADLKKVPQITRSDLLIQSDQDLETPQLIQIDHATKNIPEGYEYKSATNNLGRTFHFLASKGWDVELYYPKKKNGLQASTAYLAPAGKETMPKTQKTLLENRAATAEYKVRQFDRKMNPEKSSRFDGGPLTRRLLGALVAFHPKVSSLAWEQSIAFIFACAVIEFGGKLDFKQVTKVAPCRETFENCLLDFAVESTIIFTDTIDHAGQYYLSHDKGEKLKGNGGCVKLVAAFDDRLESEAFPDGEIIVGALDADKGGETSEDMAETVSHSVMKLDLDPETKCGGVTSDSGGGGNTESGAEALRAKDIINFADDFLVGNCVMHNMSLEMGVALKKILMDRKPDSEADKNNGKRTKKPGAVDRNVEQLLYTAFAWEHDVGLNVIREYWASTAEYVQQKDVAGIQNDEDVSDEKKKDLEDVRTMIERKVEKGNAFVLMIRGAETRWWTLGEAATILDDTLAMRRFMAKNFDDTKAQNKAQKIAQDFLSLSSEPVLLCDLALLKCFHRFYMARHLKFYQQPDQMTLKAGFQPFSIFNQCYLQELDYKRMLTSWESIPEFKDLCDRLDNIPDEPYDDKMSLREFEKYKISEFLKIAYAEHKKMFKRWLDVNKLAFLPAFAEYELGKIVCRRLLGKEMLAEGEGNRVHHSENHGRDFNLGCYASFVAKSIPTDWSSLCQSRSHIESNLELIRSIGEDGFDLWDRTNPSTKPFRKGILRRYGALFTSNQGTERANKDQNMASLNQRKESNSSVRMIAMTYIKELNDTTVVGKKRDRPFRGKEKILEMFTRVMGVHVAIENMERKLGTKEFEKRKKAIKVRLKETFSKVSIQQQKEKFQKAMKVTHVKSVKEQLSGYDVAPLLENKLQFGKLFGAKNLKLLTLELRKRLEIDTGKPLEDLAALRLQMIELLQLGSTEPLTEASLTKAKKMGITVVKAAIKYHEKKRYERLDILDDYDSRFFEVLHSPIDQYIYDPVG